MRVALLVRLFALSPALLAVGPASPALASGREPVPAPEGDDYLELQERTRERILKALPRIPEKRQLVFLGAIEVEREAKARIQAAEAGMGQVASARGLVDHAKGKWIGGADRGIAAAKEKLSKAKTPAEEQAARDELAHWEQNRRDGEQALRERQAALDAALEKQPELERELHAAREGLDAAREQLDEALMRLGLDRFLSRSSLDEDLARLQVLLEAGPASLTDFASRGRDEQRLLDDLLDDGDLLVQIAVADGAAEGNYGRALELYRDIQQLARSPGTPSAPGPCGRARARRAHCAAERGRGCQRSPVRGSRPALPALRAGEPRRRAGSRVPDPDGLGLPHGRERRGA
jgi:hypothetical protein